MTSPDSVSDARNSVLMAGVSKEHRILEVGASFGPPAPKREGWKTYTVDHEANENLVEKYVGADIRPEEIEEVDIVWREGPLHDAVPREVFDLASVGACDWWVEWIEEGLAVEFFGHLIPGAPGSRGEEEDQQHRPDLLMDFARESEEQWRSLLASKSRSHTIVPKWLARFLGMNNPVAG